MGLPPWQGESSRKSLSLVPSPFIRRNSLGMRPGELGNEARREPGNEATIVIFLSSGLVLP